MYSPLNANWDTLVRSGAKRISRLDFIANPAIGFVTVANVPISEWSGTVDRRADIRRTASASVTDFDLLSRFKDTSSFRPFSAEVVIKHGFLHRGQEILVPFGRFKIEDFDWTEDETSFSMKLNDRSKALSRTSYGTTLDASGQELYTFINDTVFEALPYVQLVIDSAVPNIRLPGGTTYRAGKLAAIQDACSAVGAEFYFDTNGVARVTLVPFIDTVNGPGPADWTIEGGSIGVLVKYKRSQSRASAFNKIHVYGAPPNGTTPQPYAFAQDDVPSSPTFFGGPFGKAETSVTRQELTSAGQCQEYAVSFLRNSIGLAKSIDLSSLGNHALQEGDIVLVTFQDASEEYHLVDGYSCGSDGTMSISTRAKEIL